MRGVIDRWLEPAAFEAGLAERSSYWEDLLRTVQVEKPDERVNRMVNIWNPYQCMATFNVSRSISSFESGIGRGIGFRDSCQDLLGFAAMAPARARQRILDLAATQLPSGGVYHQYQPLTRRGNDANWSLLDEPAPYDNDPSLAAPCTTTWSGACATRSSGVAPMAFRSSVEPTGTTAST